MSAVSTSFVIGKIPARHVSSGDSLKPGGQYVASVGATRLTFVSEGTRISSSQKRALIIQAGYSEGGRSGSTSLFIGGFVLGGLIVGTLGCVYAPQISKALTGADKKDLMKKLPKFIYDEEKALEDKLDEEDERLLEGFLSKNDRPYRTLADLIVDKIKNKMPNFLQECRQSQNWMTPSFNYTRVLARYSVNIPLKVEGFFKFVLLPHVREDIRKNKRLHFALYQL